MYIKRTDVSRTNKFLIVVTRSEWVDNLDWSVMPVLEGEDSSTLIPSYTLYCFKVRKFTRVKSNNRQF